MIKRWIGIGVACCISLGGMAQSIQPGLMVTAEEITDIREARGTVPLMDQTIDQAIGKMAAVLDAPIDVPVPKDPGGGYTHERHKQNAKELRTAGLLYQLTGEQKYLDFAQQMLLEYAELYPTLDRHPVKKSYAPGKLFWQSLNEAVWLVQAIQGYDCIRKALEDSTREQVESQLFMPFAQFLSVESPEVFNRIHNHGVWAVAAVGMTGYALEAPDLVRWAFNGVPTESGMPERAGFLAQLDALFSPDGYYTEGPYYQRYAMVPYLQFALAIEHQEPARKIFEYRDGLLPKAVETLVQLTDAQGRFLPLNDAILGMSELAPELILACDLAYQYGGQNPQWLDLANRQGSVLMNGAGLAIAQGLKAGKAEPFERRSAWISDGAEGDFGGIALLRMGEDANQWTVVVKAASQGMNHGHFDRLGVMLYAGQTEVLTDYGAARFVNVVAKEGGRYLPENKTYAKHTIAHNALVVDQASHYQGKWKKGQPHAPNLKHLHLGQEGVQFVVASEAHAYEGVDMERMVALIQIPGQRAPIALDVMTVEAEEAHAFDMPIHHLGQWMEMPQSLQASERALYPLGQANGYQHIWQLASGQVDQNQGFTWLHEGRFVSMTFDTTDVDSAFMGRLGAHDPNQNLRTEPMIMLRKSQGKTATFAQAYEIHGGVNSNTERVAQPRSRIDRIASLFQNEQYGCLLLEGMDGTRYRFAYCKQQVDPTDSQAMEIEGTTIEWQGAYSFEVIEPTHTH
ncbi:heparinase II/III family protein [Pontibacter sp. G13]|uniref:heparinase II/III domain-containing protein n=1 Tax=Pontibacter sp. G13 TaxID=3074898 RepID=UPI00288AD1DC|nr:heparinase II/III family protein [Pontibacter sp. G13]WNJ20476.1 heparinase II/III family protein [Pontibacter sp. G13]